MTTTLFGSVLVARDKLEAPSEVELSFRSKCQKLRVVSTLTGGAHFILKGTHSTVALRVYDANAIATLSSAFTQRTATSASTSEGTGNNANDTAKASSSPALVDFADGLKQFRDSFMYTIVFFVLPPGAGGGGRELRRAQLTQAGSVVNVAQRALSSSRRSTDQDQSKRMGTSRVFIVDNVGSLQSHLEAVVDSTHPEKKAMKEQFFSNQRKLNLLPNISSSEQDNNNAVDSVVPSKRLVDAFRSWADDAEIPRAEIDVAMTMLNRPLEALVTADLDDLAMLPISDVTKGALVAFFSANPEEGVPSHQIRSVPADSNADGRANGAPVVPLFPPGVHPQERTPFAVHVQNDSMQHF